MAPVTHLKTAVSPDVPDDVELANRCAADDRGAQRQLFDAYRDRVHATLYRIMGSNRDMEDLVQEAFLQVFRSIHSYRGEAKLGTWISRITTRVAYAHIGRRRPYMLALEAVPEVAAGEPDAAHRAAAREATRRLYGVLDRIEAKQRIAFALHVIDGRSIRDVAELTDSSVTATKTRVWRARREVDRRARQDPLLASYMSGKESGT